MKRKLVAALLSVAMVASITPVSALGPVATVEASADGVQEFKDAMDKFNMAADLSVIVSSNVDKAYGQYCEAESVYNDGANLTDTEKAENKDLIDKLSAAKDKIISVYIDKMAAEIANIAKTGTVTADTNLTTLETCETNLVDLGVDVAIKVTNYTKYQQIKDAKEVDSAIAQIKALLDDENNTQVTDDVSFVAWCKNWEISALPGKTDTRPIESLSNETKQLAKNYSLYLEAEARLQQQADIDTLVAEYVQRFGDAQHRVEAEGTETRISEAEALIKQADTALESALDKMGIVSISAWTGDTAKEYTDARSALKNAIDTAKERLEDQAEADEFTKKINALASKTITWADIADVQDVFENVSGYEDAKLITAETALKAETVINAMQTLIANASKPDTAFTEALIKAYPVPVASDVKQSDGEAIEKAIDFLFDQDAELVGKEIGDLIDRKSASYATAAGKIAEASVALNAAIANAEDAEKAFTDALAVVTSKNPTFKQDIHGYEYYLNKAKSLYDALDDVSKKKSTIKTAYERLKDYIEELDAYKASQSEIDIINALVAGIDALPATGKLTLANKDAVYALRDKLESLSKTGRNEFKTAHEEEDTKLTEAIKAIDKLVVSDLEKQINALVKVKPDATLAEIQAAKAANKAAREAYEALTDTQKVAVNNSKLIAEAEAAVGEAEVNYIKQQIKDIVKLDLTKLTYEQAKNIIAVQEMINGLDKSHKDALNDEFANSLAIAYKDYQKALVAATELTAKVASLENATVSAIADQTYTGEDIQPAVEVKDMTGAAVDASEYKVAYKNNVDAGTATVVISAVDNGKYTGTKEVNFTIKAADISEAAVNGATKTYTGKAVTTTVKAVAGDKTLTAGTDYEVTSYANNTNVGTATITITGKGNYTGTATGNFIVKPGKVNLTKVTAGTKKATAKYTGKPGASYKVIYAVKGTTKYKAVYSTNLTKTISGLKSGTTYKVKVLAYYKDANGKAYYTGYSNMRTVKVK